MKDEIKKQTKEEYLEDKVNKLFEVLETFALDEGIEDFEDLHQIFIAALKGFDMRGTYELD